MSNRYVFFITAIILAAFFFRCLAVNSPDGHVVDELLYVPAAKLLLEGKIDEAKILGSEPFLGSAIIAASIMIFGDNTVGWRIPSLILGTGSLFVFFLLAREIISGRAALLSTFLLSISFLHTIHSRIAMVDILFLFFMLTAFYFVFAAIRGGVISNWNWIFAGIFFGLSVSTKITAALGVITILLFLILIKKNNFNPKILIFVILIPGLIYITSYTPYFLCGHSINEWVGVQTHLFLFQTTVERYNYISYPAEWFLLEKTTYHDYRHFRIYAFANPFIWWLFIPAFISIIRNFEFKREDLLIVIWFFTFLLPLFFLPKCHIFYAVPLIPVMCLAAGKFLAKLDDRYIKIFMVSAVIVYMVVYPLLSCIPLY